MWQTHCSRSIRKSLHKQCLKLLLLFCLLSSLLPTERISQMSTRVSKCRESQARHLCARSNASRESLYGRIALCHSVRIFSSKRIQNILITGITLSCQWIIASQLFLKEPHSDILILKYYAYKLTTLYIYL